MKHRCHRPFFLNSITYLLFFSIIYYACGSNSHEDFLPTVAFSTNSQTVDEIDGAATFNLELSTASDKDIEVFFDISGSAQISDDYTGLADSVVITAGATGVAFSITLQVDQIIEDNETLTLNIQNSNDFTLGTNAEYTLTITDLTLTPSDTYFSLAVTENSHNHAGARLLFLDFQNTTVDTSVIDNNVIISPRNSKTIDGDASDWDAAHLSTVKGLVQNNYPLSEFIDAAPVDITVGSSWDADYVYFLVQWEDAGHTPSTQLDKWIYNGVTWETKPNTGVTTGAPNFNAANAAHTLSGAENEDRILIMFPINDLGQNYIDGGLGCAAYCHANLSEDNPAQHYTGTGVSVMHTNEAGETADIWHWKATRSGPFGYADDKYIAFATGTEDGRMNDSGDKMYIDNVLNQAGNPTKIHKSGFTYDLGYMLEADTIDYTADGLELDSEVPFVIGTTPNGSRADVEARSSYNSTTHTWTVEMRRKRNTGNADDRQFVVGVESVKPAQAAVSTPDITNGMNLFEQDLPVGKSCHQCHGPNGRGQILRGAWETSRNVRASGSLILNAINNIQRMSNLELTEQEAEDIAAYLQTQNTFEASYMLNVSTAGWAVDPPSNNIVTSSPSGILCPDTCQLPFIPNSTVDLTANYVNLYNFDNWSVATPCLGNNTLTVCSISMTGNISASANYSLEPVTHTLTINNNKQMLLEFASINSLTQGVDISCTVATCTYNISTGKEITLTIAAGYQIVSWGGSAPASCAGTGNCTFIVNSDVTLDVTYNLKPPVTACQDPVTPPPIPEIALQQVATGLFAPVHLTHPGDKSGRLMVVEQRGTILELQDEIVQPGFYLDIRDRVRYNGEMGLLSMAFHPQFATNNRFFVNYVSGSVNTTVNKCTTSNRCTIISEFDASAPIVEDSEKILMEIDQPFVNHNGGQIAFGPEQPTPYLYIGMGDGGDGDDPLNSGQNVNTLLGAMLRIDVDTVTQGQTYTIPADNPFIGLDNHKKEIWAYGLRNPWRFHFDPLNGILYAADVGQNLVEEIDIIGKGMNYGWRIMEGDICNAVYNAACTKELYTAPIQVHTHAANWLSITGGVVYRGAQIPDLCGVYLYGDYGNPFVGNPGGHIAGLRYNNGAGTVVEQKLMTPKLPGLSSFGYDENYEVFLLDHHNDVLYKIIAP